MKKQIKTPLQQKTIKELISLLIFYFFVVSASGYLWEVILFCIEEHKFVNRGFLYGPWLPIYGCGAVFFYLLFSKLKRRPAAAFLSAFLIGTGLELAIGWLLDCVWELRYWDYTDSILNFHGYICLLSSLGFGVAGMLWICVLSGILEKFWFKLSVRLRRIINTILILVFVVDCIAALIFPNTGKGITY
jgi:Predicted membrane protein